jgi:hypothetical protein
MATRGYQLKMSFDEVEPTEIARERVTLIKIRNLVKLIKKVWV